ncbi:hypothetical protein GSU68_10050 [Rathayibacter sp. VKM Ac-2759]|nr:hypothetical protein GSU68_10050 [Rathayibacter sp. VKM Ac-2759]
MPASDTLRLVVARSAHRRCPRSRADPGDHRPHRQKRTMEIADALHGVSMRQNGVSAVVGQRVEAPAV